ncbi:MAG: hypothetical protein AB7E47_05750 [Desulfovibrionaceae bacterium]
MSKYTDKTGAPLDLSPSEEVFEEMADGRLVRKTSRNINTISVKKAHRAAIVDTLAEAVAALDSVSDTNTAKPVLAAVVALHGQVVRLLLGSEAVGGADAS